MFCEQRVEVGGDALTVGGIVDREDLLRVVQHVVGLLAYLHQGVDDIVTHVVEPRVTGIELVAEDQSQGGHAVGARVAAALRTVLHLLPGACPFFAPGEGAATMGAGFGRKIGFLAHSLICEGCEPARGMTAGQVALVCLVSSVSSSACAQ